MRATGGPRTGRSPPRFPAASVEPTVSSFSCALRFGDLPCFSGPVSPEVPRPAFRPAVLLLGTAFDPRDLVVYVAAVAVLLAGDVALAAARRRADGALITEA